jgi:hypothetical protein
MPIGQRIVEVLEIGAAHVLPNARGQGRVRRKPVEMLEAPRA